MKQILEFTEDKPEDYGKQKCWASVGWGLFSIFIGWLVDLVSVDKKKKNYSPVFYSAVLVTVCNLITMTKIKVRFYSDFNIFFGTHINKL